MALIVVGIFLLVIGSRLFARVRTNINTFLRPDKLVTDGPFRYSRNPMYVGFVLVLLGICVTLGTLSPFAVVVAFFAVANYWYIPIEERNCAGAFGEEYARYQDQVRRWL